MELVIEKQFKTGVSAEKTWLVLSDIEKVVKCLPGASISEKKDAKNFQGLMQVKMGPMSLSFTGEAEIKTMDESKKLLNLVGAGKDMKGAGSTTLDLEVKLEGEEDCEFQCKALININGKMVQFGSRLIQSATNSVFDKFVANFKLLLADKGDEMKTSLGVGDIAKGIASGLFKK